MNNPEQVMITAMAINNLEKLPIPESDQIILNYVKSLTPNIFEHKIWHEILQRTHVKQKNLLITIKAWISSYPDLYKSFLWKFKLNIDQLKIIHEVASTHKPETLREEWLFELGVGGGDFYTDNIPPGNKLTRKTGIQLLGLTCDLKVIHPKLFFEETIPLRITITPWHGYGLRLCHYYASIYVYNFFPTYGDRIMEDYIPHICLPHFMSMASINIRRPLQKNDITKAELNGFSDRYHGYKIGDMIQGFWTKEEAIDYAQKEVEKIFGLNNINIWENSPSYTGPCFDPLK